MSTPNINSLPAEIAIPLRPEVRAAYQDLYDKIQAAIDSTMDAAALEALNPRLYQVDQVLTRDDLYRESNDTEILSALKAQIDSVNLGLASLRAEIASIASHFAMAGTVLAAIDKVLSLVPGL